MLSYYFSVLRGIPHAFRSALEAVLFWAGGFVSLVGSLSPTLWGVFPDGQMPRWLWLSALALVLVYGVLLANYRQYAKIASRLAVLEALPTERYQALCDLQERLLAVLTHATVSLDDKLGFCRSGRAFWDHAHSEAFKFLHPDERTQMDEFYRKGKVFEGDDIAGDKAILATLKYELDSWARQARPSTPPTQRAVIQTAG